MGGTKADRVALFQEFLNKANPEQTAAIHDDSPILIEIHKAFNKTLQTVVNGFAAQKSMLSSSDKECDRKANEKADIIMKKAFDEICEYLIQFRHRVRAEVDSAITDIREVNKSIEPMNILKINMFSLL